MSEPKKRGRKKRPRTTAEKLLITEFASKLEAKLQSGGWDAAKIADKLKISPASFYNYRNKTNLAGYEVLKRAHDLWGWNFEYIDFGERSAKAPSETEAPRQYVLPFIENVHESDIQVIRAKAVKPDTLLLTVQIKFVS